MNDLFLLREGFSKPLWRDLKRSRHKGVCLCMCLCVYYCSTQYLLITKLFAGGGGLAYTGARRAGLGNNCARSFMQ